MGSSCFLLSHPANGLSTGLLDVFCTTKRPRCLAGLGRERQGVGAGWWNCGWVEELLVCTSKVDLLFSQLGKEMVEHLDVCQGNGVGTSQAIELETIFPFDLIAASPKTHSCAILPNEDTPTSLSNRTIKPIQYSTRKMTTQQNLYIKRLSEDISLYKTIKTPRNATEKTSKLSIYPFRTRPL